MLVFGQKIFKNPVQTITAFDSGEFFSTFKKIEKLKNKYFIAGYIRYEAGEIFSGKDIKSDFPLLYFEVFEKYEDFTPEITDLINIKSYPDITFDEYKKDLRAIKDEIAAGNTYEVNYTYNRIAECAADDFKLFNFLIQKQKTPYNAFIKNDYETILSFSPELFFELANNHIITKPMKGTAPRGRSQSEDVKNIEFLKNDLKNRAENVMIVDLLRNDLGRIAKTGTVKVSKLFEVETHKTLHQMTSQIEADLDEDIKLFDIFKAIFPCGSITGAPKISTMNIIKKHEKGRRDIYCGAIGIISPKKTIFSVPIRILQKKSTEKNYRYRTGGAIVWDSVIKEEWEETITKSKILYPDFKLIETVKVQNGKPFLWQGHMQRLQTSAEYFGFKFCEELCFLKPEKDGILRLLLSYNGSYSVEYKNLEEVSANKVKVAPYKVNSSFEFLKHKTTYRPYFEDTYKKIAAGEVYDELFFNEKGQLTEGARSNILVEQNGRFYTPPIECGLLNGILRQSLLSSGACCEKILYKADVYNADNIYCINSVRGIRKVKL